MLEFAGKYADPVSSVSLTDRVAAGEIAFGQYGFSFDSLWYWDEVFDGKACYMGHPTPDGEKFFVSITDILYVNQSTKHKEGVLDFLAYLLTEEQQLKWVSDCGSYPVKKDAFDKLWETAKSEGVTDIQSIERNKVIYKPRKMTDEDEQLLLDALHSAVYVGTPTMSNQIWDIVYEEALPFFTGEKSAEEVAQIIDKRVQLYLDEK